MYEHSGDTNFLNDCYAPYFKPLFWGGSFDIWGAKYDGAECLKKMAVATGNAADTSHWHTVMGLDGLDAWMNAQWQKDGVTNYFGGVKPAFYPPGTTDSALYRNLPHWRQDGCTYFVTFRTADSLSRSRITEWQHEDEAWFSAHGIQGPLNEPQWQAVYEAIPPPQRKAFEKHRARRVQVELDQ